MMVVGLTGGIGSGKSEAAKLFAGLGVPVVDTDVIAHQLTAPGQPALLRIAQAFGEEILDTNGALRRDLLRQRIFSDPEARKTLEELLHPLIREHVVQELAKHPDATYQIVVVPLLFESGSYANLIHRRLVIDCDEALQVQRAMARGRLTEPEVRAIMAAQLPRNQRLAMADNVIVNDGSLVQLAAQVRDRHEKYIQACIVSHSIS
jgi:dephospho-CoA kinase